MVNKDRDALTAPLQSLREDLLTRLQAPVIWDLVVVGGGATGLGVALQAASEGLTVALLEAQDLAQGTSSRSTKLVHGGVRYLAQGHWPLVREALHERRALLERAPHLAQPLAFVMPTYRFGEQAFYGMGLKLYEWLAASASLGKTEFLDAQATQAAIAIENALEPYHIDMIHPQTLGLLRLKDGENHYIGQNSVWGAPLGDESADKKLRALGRMFEITSSFPGYEFIYMFPFTMISSTYGYSYSLQNFFPGKSGTTSFYSRLYTSKTKGEKAEFILESFFASTVEINRKVFEEDHGVCKLLPAGSWSMEPLRFAADSEGKIQHFRQACRDHVAVA